MKKIATKIAFALTLTALALSGTAFGFTQKTAAAQTENETAQTTLVAPTTYEQYLSLHEPSDVAVTNDYMAIADGNAIYVYDKKDELYRKYEHDFNKADPLKNNITKLQFDGDNRLYFLDATYLYVLDPNSLESETPTVTETKFPCSTFLLEGNTLYYTDVKTEAQLSKIDLTNSEIDVSAAVTLVNKVSSKPTIAYWQNELYYTDGGKHLYKVNPESKEKSFVAAFENEIVSMFIRDGIFLCSDINGNFFAYSLSDLSASHDAGTLTPISKYDGGYSALALLGDYVYAVKDSSVRRYSVKTSSFTDYEICEASQSLHRINGGTETLLSNGFLYVADNGNDRISVYDTTQALFKLPIPSDVKSSYLAADEKTVLAANASEAVLYDLTPETYGTVLAEFNGFNGTVVGTANVYGKYYFATENNYYYVAERNETAENGWSLTEIKKTSTRYAKLLTADAYGYLYVASGNSVYRYSEAEFLSKVAEGEEVCDSLPVKTEKILVDYAGSVYALCNNQVQKLGNEGTAYPLNTPLVYSETANVQSFTFGIEDNVTYLLYEENYIAKTTALELPTVKNIPVNGADEPIFNDSVSSFVAVRTKPDAMLVEIDISALEGATEFPYLAYNRSVESQTAIRIGQTDKHAVLALYNAKTKTYTFCLALQSDCTELTVSEYRTDYEEAQAGYLSNDVSLYKFPILSGLPTHARLLRNTELKVLGELISPDYAYYYVAYTDENGQEQTGYIPQAYVLSFDPTHPEPQEVTYGPNTWNVDAIWRLAYLILGTGAICILLDVLILRKRRDE